jgi:hypothetical protein
LNVVGIRRIVISKRGGSLPDASHAAHELRTMDAQIEKAGCGILI